MPAQTRQQEWERQRCTIWQLWVRDRLPMKDLQVHMRLIKGFKATHAEYKKKFVEWGFSQNVPVETWKYVDYQVRKRKSEGQDSTVLISGVEIPAKRVRKETSRHFYNSSELASIDGFCRAPNPWVTVCSPTIAPPKFEWKSTMPWLQFSANLPFPRFSSGPSEQNHEHQDHVESSLVCEQYLGIEKTFSSVAGPSQVAQRLAALMPERFPGEHILYGQFMTTGIQGAKLLAARLCMYRMSNGYTVEDEDIVSLFDQLGLANLIRRPGDPILKQITTRTLLSQLLGAAIQQGRPDILHWVFTLKAGVDLTTRQERIFTYNNRSRYGDRTFHFPLSLLLEDDLVQRHTTYKTWNDMIQQLLVAQTDMSINLRCCKIHGTALETAAKFQGPGIMAQVVNRGLELQGHSYLDNLNCKTLFYRATVHASPDASIDGASSFSYACGLYTSAYRPGASPLGIFMNPDGLVQASRHGGVALLRDLGRLGADFNCFDKSGEFPLGVAVWDLQNWDYVNSGALRDNAGICEELLSFGASPDLQGRATMGSMEQPFYPSALHRAVELVLQGSGDPRRIEEKHMRICEALLQNGADPNAQAFYNLIDRQRNEDGGCAACDGLDQLVPTRKDLFLAVDRLPCNHQVLATPLQRCVSARSHDLIQLLLDHGAEMQDHELLRYVDICLHKMAPRDHEGFNAVFATVAASRTCSTYAFALTMATDTRNKDLGIARHLIRTGLLPITSEESHRLSHAFGSAFAELVVCAFSAEQLSLMDCIALLKQHAPLHPGTDLLEVSAARLNEAFRPARSDDPQALLTLVLNVLDSYPLAYSHSSMCIILSFWTELFHLGKAEDFKPDVVAIAKDMMTRRLRTPHSCFATACSEHKASKYHISEFSILARASQVAIHTGNFEFLDAELSIPPAVSPDAWPPSQDPFQSLWTTEDRPGVSITDIRHRRNRVIDILAGAGHRPSTAIGLAATAFGGASVDEVKKLMTLGFDPCQRYGWSATALQHATRGQNIEMVRFLLDLGADVNASPPWIEVIFYNEIDGPLDTIHTLLVIGFCKVEKYTALTLAVEASNTELIQMLLDAGANVNALPSRDCGATALQMACIKGEVGIVKWLISKGAEIGAEPAEKNGRTALEGAAEHGRLDTVQLLVDEGCHLHGAGRRQFISAVRLAQTNNHHLLAGHLQRLGSWTQEDEEQTNYRVSNRWVWTHGGHCCNLHQSVDDSMSEPRCWESRWPYCSYTETKTDTEDESHSSQPNKAEQSIDDSTKTNAEPEAHWNDGCLVPPTTRTTVSPLEISDSSNSFEPVVQQSAADVFFGCPQQELGSDSGEREYFTLDEEFREFQASWAGKGNNNSGIEDVTDTYEV